MRCSRLLFRFYLASAMSACLPCRFCPAAHPRAGAARPAPDSPRRPPAAAQHRVRAGVPGPPLPAPRRGRAGLPPGHRATPPPTGPARPARPPTPLLEGLDFTISTKRPVLTPGSAHDGEEAAHQQAEDLYTGLRRKRRARPARPRRRAAAAPYAAALLLPRRGAGRAVHHRSRAGCRPGRPGAPPQPAAAGPARHRQNLSGAPAGLAAAGRAATKAASSWCSFTPATATRILCWASGPMPKGRFHLVPGVLPLLCQRAAADPGRPVLPAD